MALTLLLRPIRDIPGNKKCVECNGQFRDLWNANAAIGVFLCNYCADVHKKVLIPPYHRVLSVDRNLDRWSDQDLRMMALWGNDRASAYWAAEYHGKVRPQMSRPERERLVYRKYVLKEWVSQSRTWELELKNRFTLLPEEVAVLRFTEGRGRSDDTRRKLSGIVWDGTSLNIVQDIMPEDVELEDEESAVNTTLGSEARQHDYRNYDDEDSWQTSYRKSYNKYPTRPSYKRDISEPRVVTSPEQCKVKEISGIDEQDFISRRRFRNSAEEPDSRKYNKSRKRASDKGRNLGPKPEFHWRERVICDGRGSKSGNERAGEVDEPSQSSRALSRSGSQDRDPKAGIRDQYGRLITKEENGITAVLRNHVLPRPLSPVPAKIIHTVRAEDSTKANI